MYFFPTFNFSYLLYMLPAVLLGLIIQLYVKASYSRWSQVQNHQELTGAQVAQKLADRMGLYDLQLEDISGQLTDHYDPRRNVLSLSRDIAQGSSVAAMAITAHELGHAQQDQEDYVLLRMRSAMVPIVNIGTKAGWIFILLGILLEISNLAWLGVIAFSAGAIFSIATLPVELNASKRARLLLQTSGLITTEEEKKGINQVLNAAALTYVAAIAASVMQLLYFSSLVGSMNRRRR